MVPRGSLLLRSRGPPRCSAEVRIPGAYWKWKSTSCPTWSFPKCRLDRGSEKEGNVKVKKKKKKLRRPVQGKKGETRRGIFTRWLSTGEMISPNANGQFVGHNELQGASPWRNPRLIESFVDWFISINAVHIFPTFYLFFPRQTCLLFFLSWGWNLTGVFDTKRGEIPWRVRDLINSNLSFVGS